MCCFNCTISIDNNCLTKTDNLAYLAGGTFEDITPEEMNNKTFLAGGDSYHFKALEIEVY